MSASNLIVPSNVSEDTRQHTDPRLTAAITPVLLELLETRRMLSISVQLVGNVLVVQGDSSANTLVVYQENLVGRDKISVKHLDPEPDVTYSNDNWLVWDESTGVASIDMDGLGGNGTLRVATDAAPEFGDVGVDAPADIYGGGDADELTGGDYNDTIGGGDTLSGRGGNDTMRGYENADVMSGGDGNDVMYGGDGNDQLTGNAGNDAMYGDAGDDTFFANDGTGDYIDGGSGSDTAFKSATDTLVNVESIL